MVGGAVRSRHRCPACGLRRGSWYRSPLGCIRGYEDNGRPPYRIPGKRHGERTRPPTMSTMVTGENSPICSSTLTICIERGRDPRLRIRSRPNLPNHRPRSTRQHTCASGRIPSCLIEHFASSATPRSSTPVTVVRVWTTSVSASVSVPASFMSGAESDLKAGERQNADNGRSMLQASPSRLEHRATAISWNISTISPHRRGRG